MMIKILVKNLKWKIKIPIPQRFGQYGSAHTRQNSDRWDKKNSGSLSDLKKEYSRTSGGQQMDEGRPGIN